MAGLLGWIEKVQGYLQQVGYAVCLVCVVILAIVFFTGGTRGAEGGKKWGILILVGLAILSFGTSLVASLRG